METNRIVVRLHPTAAAQRLSEEDVEKLARIIRMPVASLKDHIASGRRIKIALSNHPGAARLLKLIKSFGFEPASAKTEGHAPVGPAGRTENAQRPERSIAARQPPIEKQANVVPAKARTVQSVGSRTAPRCKKSAHPHRVEGTEWKPGDVIESLYEVRDIKYGGMGAVYVVRHLRLNTMMALKSLYHRLRESEEELALFLKEAETWIDIGFHPNIAACYYVRNIKGSPRIFIEYADGGSLNEWLAGRTNVGWDLMIDLFVQVGDGLGHAHLKGLVHRDVKPGNCMLTREGVVKVTDFGLTKRRRKEPPSDGLQTFATSGLGNAPTSVTAAGMGTPAYMAPEMWVQGGEVGPPADIYAYGVMAFELCCGRKPFLLAKGDKLGKLALEHLKKTPPPPSQFRPDIPKRLESVILRCLSKSPDERYASFAEIRNELADLYQDLFKSGFPREKPDEVQLRSDALNNRAVSLMDLNHGEEAWEALKRAVEADPHHPEAVYNLWILEWLRNGEQDRDLSVRLEEVVKTPECRGRGGHLLGRCLLAQGDAEGALRACQASLSASDADEAWLKPYAMALIAGGRDEDAIEQMQSYLERYPGDDDARLWLAGALTRSGQVESALKLAGLAPPLCGDSPMTPQQIADSYRISPAKEKMVLQGHTGWVMCLAFFPTSRRLLTGARDRTLRVWDLDSGAETSANTIVGEPPDAVWISPNERIAAYSVAKQGAPVTIVNLESGRIAGHIPAQDRVTALAFSADGAQILTVEPKGAVRVWNADNLRAISSGRIHAHTAACAFFEKSGEPRMIVASLDRIIRRVDMKNSEPVEFEKVHTDQVITMAASTDGARLVSGGKDKLGVFWDALTGKPLGFCRAHKDSVTQTALNAERNLAAGYDAKAGLKLWQADKGLVFRTFPTGDNPANCLQFNPEGDLLALGGRDMCVRLWDVRGRTWIPDPVLARFIPVKKQMQSDREFQQLLEAATKAIRKDAYATAYSLIRRAQTLPGYERDDSALDLIMRMKDGGTRSGLISAWNRKSILSSSGVMDVEFSPSAINFFTAQSDHTIRMWSSKTCELVKSFRGHTNLVAALALSPNGREAVSGGDDRSARVWDIHSGRNSLVCQGHSDIVTSVAYSGDSKTILSASWDGTARLWRLPEGTMLKTFKGHDCKLSAAAFVGESGLMLTAGFDGGMRMWDLASGRILRDLKGHHERITSLRIAPSSDIAVTGSMDGTAVIWDVRRGAILRILEVDPGGVKTVAFAPDQAFVVTGGTDAVVRIYRVENGVCERELQGHSREITAVRFSSNGRYLVSSSVEGTVIIWEIDWDWKFSGQGKARRVKQGTFADTDLIDDPT